MQILAGAAGDIHLRPWRRGDEPSLVRYANNPKIAAQLRDLFPSPYTPADARDWVDRASLRGSRPTNLAVVRGGEAIGGVGIVPYEDVHRHSAEIGYWLGEPFWGRGIATRAVEAMSRYAFERFDLVRLAALVFDTNPASARVLEKCGYRFEGRLVAAGTKNGRTLDLLSYGLVREDRRLNGP